MNSHFNRQFILIDFRLLDSPGFLRFAGSSEFATYLVLRRHIWRSPEPHHMGLHEYYRKEQKLVCSLDQSKIADLTGIVRQNTSAILTSLEEKGVIRMIRTGRQNVYVLGEWLDVYGDSSYKVEWFYMEGEFGISKSDVAKRRQQMSPPALQQMSSKGDTINKEGNREKNTVNGLSKLKDLQQPQAKTQYMAQVILEQFGDDHSWKFYELVAAKVPEAVIRQALAEIKADGAEHPAKLFTHKMKLYALDRLKQTLSSRLTPAQSG